MSSKISSIITSKYTAIIFPLISAIAWAGMLITLLVAWAAQGKPMYYFMSIYSNPVYISDVAATNLQPVFISLVLVMALFHFLTVVSMFHLRLRVQGITMVEKWLGIVSLGFLTVSQFGIIFVSCFNTNVFHPVHMAFLSVFIVCVFIAIVLQIAAVFLRAKEYKKFNQGLSFFQNHYNVTGVLKVVFLFFAVVFAMCFGLINNKKSRSIVTRFEWTLSFWYTFLFAAYIHEFYYLVKQDIFEENREAEVEEQEQEQETEKKSTESTG